MARAGRMAAGCGKDAFEALRLDILAIARAQGGGAIGRGGPGGPGGLGMMEGAPGGAELGLEIDKAAGLPADDGAESLSGGRRERGGGEFGRALGRGRHVVEGAEQLLQPAEAADKAARGFRSGLEGKEEINAVAELFDSEPERVARGGRGERRAEWRPRLITLRRRPAGSWPALSWADGPPASDPAPTGHLKEPRRAANKYPEKASSVPGSVLRGGVRLWIRIVHRTWSAPSGVVLTRPAP